MARTKKGTPPAYPAAPHNGQARITVTLISGKRHCFYLGTFGSTESRTEYQRVLAELNAHGGRYPVKDDGTATTGLTLNEIAYRFWQHAETYYRLTDSSPSRELDHFKTALTPMLDIYGHTLGREFGPLAYKAVRKLLIDAKRYCVRFVDQTGAPTRWLPEHRVRQNEGVAEWRGKWLPAEVHRTVPALSRKVVNQRMDHVKRFFAWAVSDELVPPSVHAAATAHSRCLAAATRARATRRRSSPCRKSTSRPRFPILSRRLRPWSSCSF